MPIRSGHRWILIAGVILIALAVWYAATYDAPRPGSVDDDLLRLNTQGISEEPDAVLSDLNATAFDDLDRGTAELKAILSP